MNKPLPIKLVVAAVGLFGICFVTLWVPTKRAAGSEAFAMAAKPD